ncbi:cupin domain-containing protein [Streptomyces sp. NPDC014889]|uniref:cupin domain-containing protein n=1 Tax=Streptomyces sp. NPDC014889 TaxID=3364928 RepID=UPI0036F9536F
MNPAADPVVTAAPATGTPAAPAAAAHGLAPLVGDPESFLRSHWTRTPLLRRGASADAFAGLLTLPGVADLLTTRALRLPHLRLVRDGVQVAESQYTGVRRIGHGTVTDAIVPEKVLSHFSLGATLVLDAVELLVPAVREVCGRLARALACPVDAVAFLTPPDRKGLAPHIDDEDVFVLQLSGTKQWTVHDQLRPVPLTPGALPAGSLGPVALTPLLSPGDLLYVPRGTPHHAASTGGHSLHLSIAARRPTLGALTADTVLAALAAAGQDRDLDSLGPAEETGARYEATGAIGLRDAEDGTVEADFGRFRARFPAVARPVLTRLAAGEAVLAEDFVTTDGEGAASGVGPSGGGSGPLGQLLVRGALLLAS